MVFRTKSRTEQAKAQEAANRSAQAAAQSAALYAASLRDRVAPAGAVARDRAGLAV
jgi:hypothetical protein